MTPKKTATMYEILNIRKLNKQTQNLNKTWYEQYTNRFTYLVVVDDGGEERGIKKINE